MVFVDASVLIPLARTGKLFLLKKYYKEIKVSDKVKNEIIFFQKPGASEIKKALASWIGEVSSSEKSWEIKELASAEGISDSDASTIVLAQWQKKPVLTNDFRLHAVARSRSVKTIWLTSFLLKCAKENILSKEQAKKTLFDFVQAGMRLNVEVYSAIEKKIEEI